ncbi:MAG: 1-acyl-sn-glycerol-3-phosphate acyltransferase [Bacteroidales bacterium]|nr:1-acyl-sn-glycerol-3-phosphate acyltransferase [Bacteroidales bacterium]
MAVITAKEAAEGLSPVFAGKKGERLFRFVEKLTGIDEVNATHDRVDAAGVPFGPDFAKAVLDDIQVDFRIGNIDRLRELPKGAFITISNHIYGHIDGICLVDLVGHVRPKMKVMVNEMLMWIKGLVPNFISVNPTLSERTAASVTSINGVKNALLQLKGGEPLSLFPSGAVADLKPSEHWTLSERDWQDAAVKLIKKARVPIIPIRFFDRNSAFYYGLGLIDYRVRFIRLFHEMYNKRGTFPRLGIGETISVETQDAFTDLQKFKAFLRSKVYDMPLPASFVKRSELWKA